MPTVPLPVPEPVPEPVPVPLPVPERELLPLAVPPVGAKLKPEPEPEPPTLLPPTPVPRGAAIGPVPAGADRLHAYGAESAILGMFVLGTGNTKSDFGLSTTLGADGFADGLGAGVGACALAGAGLSFDFPPENNVLGVTVFLGCCLALGACCG